MQELQHHVVELVGLLHIRVMSRSRNNQLFRAGYALLQYAGNLKDFWGILVTYHDQGRYVDFGKPVDCGGFERKHVLLVCHEITMPLEML